LTAEPVTHYNVSVDTVVYPYGADLDTSDLAFCNVTIAHAYTDPERSDNTFLTQVWLPPPAGGGGAAEEGTPEWNGRLLAVGGGGWNAGMGSYYYMDMAMALATGYAALTLDGGVGGREVPEWGLSSSGHVDMAALRDFASTSLSSAASLAKAVISSYYGAGPAYSYWRGCSQGGRQGYELAQRYPDAYDGILANAPAIYMPQVVGYDFYAQQILAESADDQGDWVYPRACEMDAITRAAIAACDGLDGVEDGMVAAPEECDFDPWSIVGSDVPCPPAYPGGPASEIVSSPAAAAANAAWKGARDNWGHFLWYGLGQDANLSSPVSLVTTNCTTTSNSYGTNTTCVPLFPDYVSDYWGAFLFKELPPFETELLNMTRSNYTEYFNYGVQEYSDVIGTSNPDLTPFAAAGGKLLTIHGVADQLIPHLGTVDYYKRALDVDSNLSDYYRLFLAPGVAHCRVGAGAYPNNAFEQLVSWVEDGQAPESLEAWTPPNPETGERVERPLCAWPAMAQWDGEGDVNKTESWYC
ncbi:Tannase/feruloyl esterase, partial [Lineolata rhizophorae]